MLRSFIDDIQSIAITTVLFLRFEILKIEAKFTCKVVKFNPSTLTVATWTQL